jgi:nitroreductase
MDFKTLLTNRRSIRNFQVREVQLADVKEIIQETCLAPTAGNGQPCRFIIIRDKDVIRRLSAESKRSFLSDLALNPNGPMKIYESSLRDEGFNVFHNSPCLVYIFGPKASRSLEVDCALTAAYFMFSAASKGLGTCWIGMGANIRDPKILQEIGVPEDCRIVAPLILGYPAAIPPASERHAPDIIRMI